MVECHAALIGAAMGGAGPLLMNGIGRATGMSPEHTGDLHMPRQPVGVISLFGALASASSAAFATMAFSVPCGVAVGAVTACVVTGVGLTDMLKRRKILLMQPKGRRR
ncbi:unnamed protein product [Cladocopium goreaui]|uniref:Uncharacterized protein n=1 Tax=Cladocopium goreaui TaxID=2562237 RepID=A0A9P1FT01_9DINO|nr:unnamed protein product [Cladocopium goreaui]|mmetsp:Transcript_70394/g.155258  ORF Transcript_70394/g.155258 Transcript_70394/m.155258 type:complete len:108 (-) Transcript_70394:60-383(-)